MKKKLAMIAALSAATLTSNAAVSLRLTDYSTLAGQPQGDLTVTVSRQDLTTGLIVGLYRVNGSQWVMCISALGGLDVGVHTYDVTTTASGVPLNSPAWQADGLAGAANIIDTWLPRVVADGSRVEAWALLAAVYDTLYQNAVVTFTGQGISDGAQAAYQRYLPAGSTPGVATLYVPNPLSGQGQAGQELVAAAPEPRTAFAGAGALVLVALSRVRRTIRARR